MLVFVVGHGPPGSVFPALERSVYPCTLLRDLNASRLRDAQLMQLLNPPLRTLLVQGFSGGHPLETSRTIAAKSKAVSTRWRSLSNT